MKVSPTTKFVFKLAVIIVGYIALRVCLEKGTSALIESLDRQDLSA